MVASDNDIDFVKGIVLKVRPNLKIRNQTIAENFYIKVFDKNNFQVQLIPPKVDIIVKFPAKHPRKIAKIIKLKKILSKVET